MVQVRALRRCRTGNPCPSDEPAEGSAAQRPFAEAQYLAAGGVGIGLVVRHEQHRQAALARHGRTRSGGSRARSCASSLLNGSSSSSARGSASSVRISATRARWPPDSVAGIAVGEAGEVRFGERRLDARAALGAVAHAARQREREVAADRQMREQQVVLEQDADAAALRRRARSTSSPPMRDAPAAANAGSSVPATKASSVDLPAAARPHHASRIRRARSRGRGRRRARAPPSAMRHARRARSGSPPSSAAPAPRRRRTARRTATASA